MKKKIFSPEVRLIGTLARAKTRKFVRNNKDAILAGGAMAITSLIAYAVGYEQGDSDSTNSFMKNNELSIETAASIKAGKIVNSYNERLVDNMKSVASSLEESYGLLGTMIDMAESDEQE